MGQIDNIFFYYILVISNLNNDIDHDTARLLAINQINGQYEQFKQLSLFLYILILFKYMT